MRIPAALCVMAAMTAPNGLAWGAAGHRIIAKIAAARLSPGAARSVLSRLGGKDLAEAMATASTWPDEINKTATGTTTWHFVDVPIDRDVDLAKDCPNSGCLVGKIDDFTKSLLATAGSPVSAKENIAAQKPMYGASWTQKQQLSFLIHLVGDAYQPLHCATNADLGANCLLLRSAGGSDGAAYAANLHAFWDQAIVLSLFRGSSEVEFAAALARRDVPRTQQMAGSPIDWIRESHRVAQKVYADLHLLPRPLAQQPRCDPALRPISLPPDYVERNRELVSAQFLNAGAHLAAVLNQIYAKQ